MDKEKIQKILRLMDGVTQREWEALKHEVDFLCEVQSASLKLPVSPKAIEYLGDRAYEVMNLERPDEELVKKFFD